jgi:hypothetical protein
MFFYIFIKLQKSYTRDLKIINFKEFITFVNLNAESKK